LRTADRAALAFSAEMRNFWNRCVRFVQTPWFYRRKFRIVRSEELPDKLKKHKLYAIGEGVPWLAALQCPCGCGAIVQLSLLENDRPRWRLRQEKDGTATLSPSIWRSTGCKSHFFLREGLIVWCNSGRNPV
jgi:hypothetical protein